MPEWTLHPVGRRAILDLLRKSEHGPAWIGVESHEVTGPAARGEQRLDALVRGHDRLAGPHQAARTTFQRSGIRSTTTRPPARKVGRGAPPVVKRRQNLGD